MAENDHVDTSGSEASEESKDNLVTLRRSEIKVLEKKAKERDDAFRRLAFAEAGLPLGDKRIAYFIKGYDGELNVESIRSAAEEIGLLDTAPTQQQPGQTTVDQQVEQEALRQVYSASQGSGTPAPGDVEAAAEQAYAEGGTEGLMQFLASQGVPISED